jgi:hypothetical protein
MRSHRPLLTRFLLEKLHHSVSQGHPEWLQSCIDNNPELFFRIQTPRKKHAGLSLPSLP